MPTKMYTDVATRGSALVADFPRRRWFSPRGGGSARAAPVQPARRSNSRRFARNGEPRPSACVRTRSLRGMPAQRTSNLSQQQAPQGVRGACSLARRSTLDAPHGAARVLQKSNSPWRPATGMFARARSEAQFTPARTGWTGSGGSSDRPDGQGRAPGGGWMSCSSGSDAFR